ncbi:MAG: chloride channel protein [Actinobacteria bacterium]|nr:chloride channel protein [Actinomycetota bacterium]
MQRARVSYPSILLMALLVGIITGLVVLLFYLLTISLIWSRVLPAAFVPGAIFVLPAAGLFFGGLILTYLAKSDTAYPTDAVLQAYHEPAKEIDLTISPWKVLSSALVVGLGGSAGIAAPMIYAGGSIGQLLYNMFKFDPRDRESFQIILMSGVAAGFAAAFKAPFTGTLLALELPFRRTLDAKPAIPALISALTAYAIMVSVVGKTPFFQVAKMGGFTLADVVGALFVGILCGLGSRLYILLYQAARSSFSSSRVRLYLKTLLGGVATGFIAFFGLLLTGAPFVLGAGFEAVRAAVDLTYNPFVFLLLVFLKGSATVATIASGAFGGSIGPLVVMGSSTGAAWGGLVPLGAREMMPVVGIAGFLSGGYNVPLAAAVLAVETSGAPSALIPALATALVARIVSGPESIMSHQSRQ